MEGLKLRSVALGALKLMEERPSQFAAAIAASLAVKAPGENLEVVDVFDALRAAEPNEPLRMFMHRQFAQWDYATDAPWAPGTLANSRERRQATYDVLALSSQDRATCDAVLPPYTNPQPLLVIANELQPWYTPELRAMRSYYWSAYRSYLSDIKGWDDDALADLDDSATTIVSRISNPSALAQYQAKGLVVGYVQSGKTANFTAVIAKAADAGYRLFIVLSGTMNLLRSQTQRRIDKELLGKELIRPRAGAGEVEGDVDYLNDDDWDNFISHGGRPSDLGAFDWQRLTGPVTDYQSLRRGIDSLEFDSERVDRTRPFFDPVNLHSARARLMVVKKNASVLRKVAADLSQIRARLGDVPTLVIDDESDQASINTKVDRANRTAVNRRVVELLAQLPRSQYVGYTATPFANVFVDPEDASDIYPKDFIVSLRRPKGYMGVRDFHDLDGVAEGEMANETAFVRDVRGPDEESDNVLRALDSFVLAGALKLYRRARGIDVDVRHHTMLVHTSQLTLEHHQVATEIRRIWRQTGYNGGDGVRRLKHLYAADFLPVTAAKGMGLPMPGSFNELMPCIGECLKRIAEGPDPLLVVNGTEKDSPDFDRLSVWKVIVGGAKLSRGYTVEGLTVSYYRRTTTAADTLMQMGRWFGFRHGYSDLVRLFIGREERLNSKQSIDLYDAFEAVCRDEEDFRRDLQRYVHPANGAKPITPKEVPPLVPSHMALLRPTATNKMYNAVVKFRNYGGRQVQTTMAPSDRTDKEYNETVARELLETVGWSDVQLVLDQTSQSWRIDAFTGIATKGAVITFLKNYRWRDRADLLNREIEFLKGTHGDPEIDSWAIIAPQLADATRATWDAAGRQLRVINRGQVSSGRYKVYTTPPDVVMAQFVAGVDAEGTPNAALAALAAPRRGSMLLYAVLAAGEEEPPNIGFALFIPRNANPTAIMFGVRDENHPDDVVVPAPEIVID